MLILVSKKYAVQGKIPNLHCVPNINPKAFLVVHRKCCWIFQSKGNALMKLSKTFYDKSMYFETRIRLPGFCINSKNFMTHQMTKIRVRRYIFQTIKRASSCLAHSYSESPKCSLSLSFSWKCVCNKKHMLRSNRVHF